MNNKAFSKIWIIIILIIFLAGGIFAWQYFGMPEEEIKEGADTQLTLEELKNAEYFVVEYNEGVQLQDGYYFKPWQPDSATGLEVQIYNNKVAFGDLNNDGNEDAVVVLAASGGGSGSFRSLVIMLNEEGKPLYLTEESLGDRVVVNSINIESGIITLDMIVHAPGDGLCCPSLEKIFKYRLSENQLLEVNGDKTTIWQTYKNEKYGYEIKYPEDWFFIEDACCPPPPSYISLSDCSAKRAEQRGCLNFSAFIHSDTGGGNLDEIEEVKLIKADGADYEYPVVSGVMAIKLIWSKAVSYYIIKGDYTYRMNFSSDCVICDQILSTFKFFEDRKEIEDWKTYQNEEYIFEIKYPKDWAMEIKQPSYLCQEGPGYKCLASIQFSPPFPLVKTLKDIDLIIITNPDSYSADRWIEKYTPEILKDPQTSLDKDVRIGENNWVKLLTIITKDNQRIAFSVTKDKKLYSFGTVIGQGMEKAENILNQMLFTFRFLE